MPALQVCALFDRYKAARKRDRSWSILELRLAPFVAAYGDRVVDGLAVIDWTTHAANRRDTRLPGKRGAAGECYSETTISAELGALKAMISWAVVQGLLRFNPLTAARRGSRKRRRTAPKGRPPDRWMRAGACSRLGGHRGFERPHHQAQRRFA